MNSEHLHFSLGKEFTDVSATFIFRSAKTCAPAKQIVGFPDIGAVPAERAVKIERRYRAPKGGAVYGVITFEYLTHTGSNWRGPIGELVAEVELRDGLTIEDVAWDDDPFLPSFQKGSQLFTKPSRS